MHFLAFDTSILCIYIKYFIYIYFSSGSISFIYIFRLVMRRCDIFFLVMQREFYFPSPYSNLIFSIFVCKTVLYCPSGYVRVISCYVPVVFWLCSGYVPVMFWLCSGYVLGMYL